MRHAFATLNLDAGASLRDLQDAMGHSSPRTTRRYDRSRGNLDRSPATCSPGTSAVPTEMCEQENLGHIRSSRPSTADLAVVSAISLL